MKTTSFHSLSLPYLHTSRANKIKQTKRDQNKRPFPKEKLVKRKKKKNNCIGDIAFELTKE
jgi:hypothetical protein